MSTRSPLRNATVLILIVAMLALPVSAPAVDLHGESARDYSMRTDPRYRSDGPCDDSLYVALKARPLTEMSDREYEYFSAHDRLCVESRLTGGTVDSQTAKEIRRLTNWQIGVFVGAVVVGLIAALADDGVQEFRIVE